MNSVLDAFSLNAANGHMAVLVGIGLALMGLSWPGSKLARFLAPLSFFAGLALIVWAIFRHAAWAELVLAILILVAVALERRGKSTAPLPIEEMASVFPDVEFHIRGTGFKTITEEVAPDLSIERIVIPLTGVRMTNHETEKRVSLTFHAKVPLRTSNDTWETPLFPRTQMPIDVAPQSSETSDIEFDRGVDHPSMEQTGPVIVEVEDHLSGLRTPLPTLGAWRPAKDGVWTGVFPAPPVALLVERDRPAQWSNFKHRARILEQHLVVTNQTSVVKTLEGFFCESKDGISVVADADWEVKSEVEKRKSLRPELRRHAILEPGDTVKGWVVHAFRYTPTEMQVYTLGVIDETGQKYEVMSETPIA